MKLVKSRGSEGIFEKCGKQVPLLFDLSKDISEQNNVALQNLEITESLLKKLGDWDVKQPHPLFLEGAVWKKRQLHLYDVKYPLVQPE